MAEKEALEGSVQTVKEGDGVQSFPSIENIDPSTGSTAPPTPAVPGSAAAASDARKKRGRPRKYPTHGSIAGALSPTPISVSIPLTGDYSVWKSKKKQNLDFENAGGGGALAANSVGGSFIPHVVTVNPGEDVMQRIISFSQQGTRAICILSANGTVSNVTLSQANSSGGTLSYEGRFEILSLTGSFIPSETGLTKTTSGGMSVSLAGNDGRVLGGGLAGMLVAASHVQVVIGSFVVVRESKKPKYEHTISFAANTISTSEGHTNVASSRFYLTGSTNSGVADLENEPGSEASEDSRGVTR